MNQTPCSTPHAPCSSNITWHDTEITPKDREKVLGQRGCVLWFSGLSGSGKSTIASALEATLIKAGHATYVLDGDNIRHGLNSDLDFSPESRTENIRRMGEVAALFADAGIITITAFISPYKKDRDQARAIIENVRASLVDAPKPDTRDQQPETRFFEIFINTPLEICESRDPKNLYKKARAGEIKNFTGISAPFEAPKQPEIEILTTQYTVQECADQILQQLKNSSILDK